jgi:hypothetical protein
MAAPDTAVLLNLVVVARMGVAMWVLPTEWVAR